MPRHDHRRPPRATAHRRSSGDHVRQDFQRGNLRATIAQAAARLIAEGQSDYHAAKLKAARQLGVDDHQSLPDNLEIDAALRERLSLFARDSQPQVLAALRETALRVMDRLEAFSPWLVGSVLAGTANEFSQIELELVGVETKDFELYLLNHGIRFDTREMPGHPEVLRYEMEFDSAPVAITLHARHGARQSLHPRESLRHDRARREEAAVRFALENKG